jgi:cell wall assembly regulator SMI1
VAFDWRAVLQDERLKLRSAATEAEVRRVEELLESVLPIDLRRFYLVSDGVFDKLGQWWVLWPLDELVRRNQQAWALGQDLQLVGFGDDGTGDPFCVPRDGGAGVFIWHPVGRAAYRLADTVEEFWSGWLRGTITT